MEKGNSKSTDGGGSGTAVGTGEGAGPSEVADQRAPSVAEWGNADGTTGRKTVEPGGKTTYETLDSDGNPIPSETRVETPRSDGSGMTDLQLPDENGILGDAGSFGDQVKVVDAEGNVKWISRNYAGEKGSVTDYGRDLE